MALDRIDIGLGPRLGTAPTDTSGFQFTGQTALSADEYQSRRVDFTKEYYGLPGLATESGIDVKAPEVGGDISPFQQQDSDDDDNNRPLFGGTLIQGDGKSQEIKFTGDVLQSGMTDFETYSDYLRSEGKLDRVDLIDSIFEPFTRGDYAEMDFDALGREAGKVPGKVEEGIKKVKKEGITSDALVKSAFSTFGGIPGSIIASFFGGETVKNAFGNTAQRGIMADIVHAGQYQDMAKIRAANEAGLEAGGIFMDANDTGFAMQFGTGFGVTRAPGASSYRGNYNGMSFEQIKDLEALSKGYRPETFRFDMKKENIFGGRANVSVEDDGGIFSDPNNRAKGFYTDKGTYYTPGVGYSRYGNRSDLQRVATTNGLDYKVVEGFLQDARAGKGKFGDLIRGEVERLAQVERDRIAAIRAEEKRLADEAAELARRQKEAAQYQSSVYSDDNESGQVGGGGVSQSVRESVAMEGGYTGGGRFGGFASGGTVGMAAGGPMAAGMGSGFVDRPPSQVSEQQTVADNVETQLPEGAFVINAAAVEFAGEQDIQKMLMDAQKEAVRRGIVLDKSGNSAKLIDVAISRGEVTVAPYLAKIIGYDRLNKINNRGKPEVAERQREASSGGFI